MHKTDFDAGIELALSCADKLILLVIAVNTQSNPMIAPDISVFRDGNTGVEYIHQFQSHIPGPNVVITGVVHGNELCGAHALSHLLTQDLQITKGRLTLIFANPEAYQRFDKDEPFQSRSVDEDFNRVWDWDYLVHGKESVELKRAREIRPYIDEADYLLDLHSMGADTAPLCMTGPSKKSVEFAQSLNMPMTIIMDRGHQSGRRMRDYGSFNDEYSPKISLLVECGTHWKQETYQFAKDVSQRFLITLGLLDQKEESITQKGLNQRILEVTHPITVHQSRFMFRIPVDSLDIIARQNTILGYDGDEAVKTPYDNCYLIMPQHGAQKGQTAVRLAREITI